MNPYRTPALRRPKHALGSDRARRLKVAFAFAVFAATTAIYASAAWSHVSVVFFGPFVFGSLLLAQARSGGIELRPEERAGEVVLRHAVRAKRTRFAYADVIGTTVARVAFMGSPADYELRLALSGDRSIPLVRGRADEIESARAGVDEFLRDNGVGERREP